MGLKDFASGVKDAAANIGEGANYLANPTHWDDVARGVGQVGEFVVEHPGQTLAIAGTVGKAIIKDQMDPKNLAITAGLLAATAATGGLAAPAFAAKLGLGVKSVQAGIAAGKGAQTIGTAAKTAKAVDTARDTYRAGKLAMQTADKVRDVTKAVDTATDVAKGVDTATDVGKNLSRGQRFAQDVRQTGQSMKTGNALERFDAITNAPRELVGAGREAIGVSRYGMVKQARAAVGNKALEQGMGKMVARTAAGSTNPLLNPAATTNFSRSAVRVAKVQGALAAPGAINTGVEAAADPVGYAMEHGGEEKVNDYVNERAGSGTGYTDLGQTSASLYGNEDQLAIGPGTRSTAFGQGASSATTPQATSPYGMKGAGNQQPPSGPPPTGTPTPSTPSAPSAGTGTSSSSSSSSAPPRRAGDWMPKGQHFWEGPRSQWAGGISANYDWRPIDPLRKIDSSSPRQAQRRNAYLNKKATWNADTAAQGELNEQGAPANFSPEIDKEGMHAISAGQQPLGALNPGQPRMGEGPVVRSGEARGSRHYATPRPEPIGALGAGSATSRTSSIIDVDSSSPSDYGVDQKGQGFFDLHSMGSSLADVGVQPNTTKPNTKSVGSGPTVHNTSSRNMLRRSGQPTTGIPATTLGRIRRDLSNT